MSVPVVQMATDLPRELIAAHFLQRADFDGIIEFRTSGWDAEVPITVTPEYLSGVTALIYRPTDPLIFNSTTDQFEDPEKAFFISPKHLQYVSKPFYVGTFAKGKNNLKHIKDCNGVTIISSELGGNAAGVADLIIYLAYSLLGRFHPYAMAMERGIFERPTIQTRPEGKTWLILGDGDQVKELIPRLHAINVRKVIIWHPEMSPEKFKEWLEEMNKNPMCSLEMSKNNSLQAFDNRFSSDFIVSGTNNYWDCLAFADIVSPHIPAEESDKEKGRKKTVGMIGEKFVRSMKPGAVLLNAARGELVDENAIVSALKDRHLGGYGGDVVSCDAEMARDPQFSTLWELGIENARIIDVKKKLPMVLLPHLSGSADIDLNRVSREVIFKLFLNLGINKNWLKETAEQWLQTVETHWLKYDTEKWLKKELN